MNRVEFLSAWSEVSLSFFVSGVFLNDEIHVFILKQKTNKKKKRRAAA